MADPKVRFKRSSVPNRIPDETQLPLGEIALNTYDGKVFASKNVGIGTTVFTVNPWNVGTGTDSYDINFTAGNVGVGSTLPTSALSVTGDANISGVVTATSFSGSGSNLTGIVTYITAGSGISIDQNTGNVTITSTGTGAGSSALTQLTNYIITLTPSFNGITTAFTMQYGGNNFIPNNEEQLIVSLAGVIQEPGVSYTVNSSTLTFASAPNSESNYFIVALNGAAMSRNVQSFNLTGVQTNFTLTNGYTVGYVDVFLNGAKLVDGDDYSATNGSVVGLTSAAQNGDVVEIIGYKAASLSTGDLSLSGDLYVTGVTTSTNFYGSLTGGSIVGTSLSISGISTLSNTVVGGAGTELVVNGDARVTGILTVGSSSLTLNGNTNQINGITISSGIVTASSFVGDLTGNATGLSGTPNIVLGIVTASSFAGDLTGNATGLSGTPNIVLGIVTASSAEFSGNVSIAGTLTYEDVTNVDSIGIITARAGAHVATTSGNLLVGTTSDTGTASQTLQVTGGAYISGSVGIGSIIPTQALDVSGSIREQKSAHVSGANDYHLELFSPNDGLGTGEVSLRMHQGSQWWGQIRLRSNGFHFTQGADNTYRDVYIASLLATGNVTAYSSDERLKENIKNLENPVEKVLQLNGCTFDWNEKSKELGFIPKHETNDIGLLAQEVEKVLPQAVAPAPFDRETNEFGENVSKSGENYLTIQYERLVPLLVEAIKEQQEQINTLKEEINELKK